jgi:hypothetical protein
MRSSSTARDASGSSSLPAAPDRATRSPKARPVGTGPLLTAGRVLVVSDPLHMRRAMRMAIDLGLDAHPSPTPTSRYRSLTTQLPMLLREVYFSAYYLVTGN